MAWHRVRAAFGACNAWNGDTRIRCHHTQVRTLTETLKHVESISGNLSKMSGDRSIQNNLKQLIEALSKLLAD